MDISEMITRRTGMDADDAAYYAAMAEARVRAYLHLSADADITPYTFAVADIAVLYWQRDTSTRQTVATLGFSSRSFSEGGVSESVSGMTGAAVVSTYETAIENILGGLDGSAGRVVFL